VADLPNMVLMSAGGLQTVRACRASAGEGSSSAMSATAAAASTSRAAFDTESKVAPASGSNVESDIQTQTAHRATSAPEMAAAVSSASTASTDNPSTPGMCSLAPI